MQPQIKQVKFKAGLPSEIEVIPIAATNAKHRVAMSVPHRAEFYQILWVQEGSATYLIDFEPVQVKANSFLFINKDRVKALNYRSDHDGKISLFMDSFFAKSEEDTKFLHSTILFNDLLETPVIDVTSFFSLHRIFNEIEAELEKEPDAYQSDIAHSLLHSLLLIAERERRKQGFTEIKKGADLDYTVSLNDLVEAQFKTLKSVSGYAAQINVSEKRLTNATSKTLGKSPKTIIDERVILEAKRLLLHTNFSIKEVGYELGFEDPAYFIRYFRKHVNKTPIEFRGSYFSS